MVPYRRGLVLHTVRLIDHCSNMTIADPYFHTVFFIVIHAYTIRYIVDKLHRFSTFLKSFIGKSRSLLLKIDFSPLSGSLAV